MALEALGWSPEETQFPIEGRILFTQPNDANWKKVWTVKMSSIQAVLCVLSPDSALPEVGSNKELIFPPDTSAIKDASLVLIKKQALVRVSLFLAPKSILYVSGNSVLSSVGSPLHGKLCGLLRTRLG